MFSFLLPCTLWVCAANEPISFRINRSNGESQIGTISKIEADGRIQWTGSDAIPADEIVSLQRQDEPIPSWPDRPQLVFRNGDRLVGEMVESDGRLLHFIPEFSGVRKLDVKGSEPMRIPVSRLEMILFQAHRKPLVTSSLENLRERDALQLKSGDQFLGSFMGISKSEKSITLEVDKKTRVFPLTQITALNLNGELSSNRKPDKLYWKVTLANGSRLSLVEIQSQGNDLIGQTFYRSSVRFPLEEVRLLERLGPKVVELSDLIPTKYIYRPFLNESLPWKKDRDWNGSQFSLATKSDTHFYDRGITQHGRSSLTFALDGKYTGFQTLVGMDSHSASDTQADIQILLDGKQALSNEKRTVSRASEPQWINLKIEKVKEITLSVDWGEGGPVNNVVNWCQPRLLAK